MEHWPSLVITLFPLNRRRVVRQINAPSVWKYIYIYIYIYIFIYLYSFVDTVDRKETTPLHTAAKLGDVKIVEMLLQGGSSVSSKSSDGKTPLHYSVRTFRLWVYFLGYNFSCMLLESR